MIFKKLEFAMFSRRALGTTDPGVSGAATSRRGAVRRTSRARQLALEAMEDRLVLSPVTLTNMSVFSAAHPTGQALIGPQFSGAFIDPMNPPPLNGDGDGDQAGGDVVSATYTLPAGYTGPAIKVGLADYIVAPGTFPPATTDKALHDYLNAQTYYSSSTGTLDANHLSVTVYTNLHHSENGEDCDQQLDAFVGDPITKFSGSNYYGYFDYLANHSAQVNLLGGAIVDCTPGPKGDGAESPGYYKNHPDALPDFMTIGNVVYSRDELEFLLHLSKSGGNATLINFYQLVTAYANQANGVQVTPTIVTAMQQSEALFSTIPSLIALDSSGHPVLDSSGNFIYNTAATVTTKTNSGLANSLTNLATTLSSFNP